MTHAVDKDQKDQGHIKAHDLLNQQDGEKAGKHDAKRQQFLAMLKKQYGYDNDSAVDELTRLLKQFYQINRGFAFHHPRAATNQSHNK